MKLVITEGAWQSLDRLQKYWARFTADDRVEERVGHLIDEATWLCKWPGAGAQEPFFLRHRKAYRRWVVGQIKIVHRIDGDTLYVLDFFDSRQRPRRMKR